MSHVGNLSMTHVRGKQLAPAELSALLFAGQLQNLSNKVTNFTVCAAPAALPLLSPQGQQASRGCGAPRSGHWLL